jgi:hypothetical protein
MSHLKEEKHSRMHNHHSTGMISQLTCVRAHGLGLWCACGGNRHMLGDVRRGDEESVNVDDELKRKRPCCTWRKCACISGTIIVLAALVLVGVVYV